MTSLSLLQRGNPFGDDLHAGLAGAGNDAAERPVHRVVDALDEVQQRRRLGIARYDQGPTLIGARERPLGGAGLQILEQRRRIGEELAEEAAAVDRDVVV